MSEGEDKIGDQLDWCSDEMSDITTDLIDVSSMNFDDHESWLQPSACNSSEYRVHDPRAWLKADIEQENRRSVDTRTFTRPKKRLGRLSFESDVRASTSPSPDVWKSQVSNDTDIRRSEFDDADTLDRRRESPPSMLRPANPEVVGLCSANAVATSGPESLELFINMSQSKGIDSFINLAEPEFSDAIMNISQPSLLYSSMMSTTRDDLSQTLNQSQSFNNSQISNNSQIRNQSSLMDSQILTESMMQSSMFGDVEDVHVNEIFWSNNADVTVVDNTNFCDDKTFVNGTFEKPIDNATDVIAMDATYTPTMLNRTLKDVFPLPVDPHASYIVDQKCQNLHPKTIVNDASFVINRDVANDASYVVRNETTNIDCSEKFDRHETDDATFKLDIPRSSDNNDTFDIRNFDATFEKTPSSPRKSSMKLNVPAAVDDDTLEFDATFKKTPTPSPRKSPKNSTLTEKTVSISTPSSTYDEPMNSTFKAPAKMDTTYDHNIRENFENVPLTNRYNTYRKVTSVERSSNENYATNNLTINSSNETVNIVNSLENLNGTFNKPAQRVLRKLNAPRSLSRLPQSLQKSNPNLISNSLKATTTVARSTAIPSYGFSKLARPSTVRNPESSLAGKHYGLSKTKSGSEQRLEVARKTGDYKTSLTGGSTESIESTQSAHSAPDLDDRLSVCSDSSHNSYSMRTMIIKDLQKATHLRVDHSKMESTPKPSRRILENTWVEPGADLPSPILKNGSEIHVSRGSSPLSTTLTVKTSSPLLSPVGSLQNLTTNLTDPLKDNNAYEKKLSSPRNQLVTSKKSSEATVKTSQNAGESRTGLKPPGSWSSGNQRPTSGIPRPASRIPAPRFTRAATSINQGGAKKGCL